MELKIAECETISGGGAASPKGFLTAGVTAGFKASGKPDMALIFSEKPCTFAGLFTSNVFAAAPVQLCRERCESQETVRAIVVNSGFANACTGAQGLKTAHATTEYAAEALGLKPEEVLVASTGHIGDQLPMALIRKGVDIGKDMLKRAANAEAATAIMTTDTRPKFGAVSFQINGKTVTLGGMTKGAGMIAPGMKPAKPHATLLCFLTTDAAISKPALCEMLTAAVDQSFNSISVDNDMSTNDTCLLLANGESGVTIESGTPEAAQFQAALNGLTAYLAQNMVMDGEGTTKMVTVIVSGAASAEDAQKCAKAICDSMLCKTAWFGCDPNWGRITCAAGYSGAKFDPEKVSLDYDEYPVVRNGMAAGTPDELLTGVLARKPGFTVHYDLGAGEYSCRRWTSDISYEYVKINADYRT